MEKLTENEILEIDKEIELLDFKSRKSKDPFEAFLLHKKAKILAEKVILSKNFHLYEELKKIEREEQQNLAPTIKNSTELKNKLNKLIFEVFKKTTKRPTSCVFKNDSDEIKQIIALSNNFKLKKYINLETSMSEFWDSENFKLEKKPNKEGVENLLFQIHDLMNSLSSYAKIEKPIIAAYKSKKKVIQQEINKNKLKYSNDIRFRIGALFKKYIIQPPCQETFRIIEEGYGKKLSGYNQERIECFLKGTYENTDKTKEEILEERFGNQAQIEKC